VGLCSDSTELRQQRRQQALDAVLEVMAVSYEACMCDPRSLAYSAKPFLSADHCQNPIGSKAEHNMLVCLALCLLQGGAPCCRFSEHPRCRTSWCLLGSQIPHTKSKKHMLKQLVFDIPCFLHTKSKLHVRQTPGIAARQPGSEDRYLMGTLLFMQQAAAEAQSAHPGGVEVTRVSSSRSPD
jgi:hypothetical protein